MKFLVVFHSLQWCIFLSIASQTAYFSAKQNVVPKEFGNLRSAKAGAWHSKLETWQSPPTLYPRATVSSESCHMQARQLLAYILRDVRQWASNANDYATSVQQARVAQITRATLGSLDALTRNTAGRRFRLVMHEIDIINQGRVTIHCDWQNSICPAYRRDTRAVTWGNQNHIVLVCPVRFSMRRKSDRSTSVTHTGN